ncbi:MAG: single-stranded DNA-binding protein [Clostridia bacterium]|nr:single-stranded DNA-binding protein [Clostridia bacterium]
MNKLILIGNLTCDPEIIQMRDGGLRARVSVAINRNYADGADFLDVTFWGKKAEFIEQYLYKGYKVAIEARLENNNYTDKDGRMRYTLRLHGEEIEFLSAPQKKADDNVDTKDAEPVSNAKLKQQQHIDEFLKKQEEDLPF